MKPIYYLIFLILCLSSLTACDNKYPTANIPDEPLAKPLEIIIEPKKVAMTSSWAAGIKEDGTLWTWGSGQGNLASELGVDPTPLPVKGINDAVAISAGTQHMLLLRKDGSVWGWGDNGDGQIDPNSDDYFVLEPRRIEGVEGVVDMHARWSTSTFVTKTGEVYILGDNEHGLYGQPTKNLPKPTKINGLKNIIKAQAGSDFILALDKFGNLYSSSKFQQYFGDDTIKPITDSYNSVYYPITKLNLPKKVVDFDVLSANIILLEDGTVWSWGNSDYTGHGKPTSAFVMTPTRIPTLSKITKISAYSALTQEGDFYVWGLLDIPCSFCSSGFRSKYYYSPILIAQNINISQYVDTNTQHGFIDKNGQLWTWSVDRHGITKSDKNNISLEKSLFTTY